MLGDVPSPRSKRRNKMQMPVEGGLWTAFEVAAFLKCSTSYVYKAAEREVLRCLRVGRMLRFEQDAVRAFARGERPNG
jgi:excisionase family DNA binding protein